MTFTSNQLLRGNRIKHLFIRNLKNSSNIFSQLNFSVVGNTLYTRVCMLLLVSNGVAPLNLACRAVEC